MHLTQAPAPPLWPLRPRLQAESTLTGPLTELSGGGAKIAVMLARPSLGLALSLLPVQILWVNLLTHGLTGRPWQSMAYFALGTTQLAVALGSPARPCTLTNPLLPAAALGYAAVRLNRLLHPSRRDAAGTAQAVRHAHSSQGTRT